MSITKEQVHFSADEFRVYATVYSMPGARGSLIITPDKVVIHHSSTLNSTIIVGISDDNECYENILENMKTADRKLVLCTGMRLYNRATQRYFGISVQSIQEYPTAGYIEIRGTISNDGGEDILWRNDTKNRIECSVFLPKITRVAYNFPATIVWWSDGTKTVVKMTEADRWLEFDMEVGLAMAISRKYLELSGYSNVRSAFKGFIDEADVYSV